MGVSGLLHLLMIFLVLLWCYLMKEESDVYSIFKNFHKMICTQFSTVVEVVRSIYGLYFLLPNEVESGGVPRSANHSLRETLPREAWLWHQRLGHPSFYLLRYLFPLLNNQNVFEIFCETCELGKHHRATFNLSLNKSLVPFQLIYTDVWGASHIPP